VDVVLALIAALLFALGTVLQQRAGMEAPSAGASSGLLLRMARRPVWVMGIAADGLGFVAQAAALAIGALWLLLTGLTGISYLSADLDSVKGLLQRGDQLLFGAWLILLGLRAAQAQAPEPRR